MSELVSDRLRAALERLDQAIDQLESRVEATEEAASTDDNSANGMIAERLDRMIERIELALAS
jgi:hypothetical protein